MMPQSGRMRLAGSTKAAEVSEVADRARRTGMPEAEEDALLVKVGLGVEAFAHEGEDAVGLVVELVRISARGQGRPRWARYRSERTLISIWQVNTEPGSHGGEHAR